MAHITKRRVEFSHTDMAGVAHFAEYFRYMESAEHEFFRSVGLSVHQAWEGDAHLSWPRVSCAFEFIKPLVFEQEFEVHLWVERVGERSVTFAAEIISGGDLRARGRCTTVCCAVTAKGMEAMPIPAAYRQALASIQEDSSR